MNHTEPTALARPGWPAPRPEQIQVLLLGSYHMDDPGLDAVNVDTDDVLTEERQAELVDVVDRVARFDPDRVAVERPFERREAMNSVYESYRSGERAYDREERIDPPHPMRDEQTTECRSEVVQLGFRLADRQSHERVAAVDDPVDVVNDDLQELRAQGFDPETKVDVSEFEEKDVERELSEKLAASTIPEYLRWLNLPEQLAINHRGLFGEYLRWGDEEHSGGPRMLSTWYDSNLTMVHNLWRAVDEDDERVVVVVGSGHVRVLRHLLGEMPQFCPVSPLPYLA